MPDKHAVLSASSSHRWLACPPSARICAASEDTPSEFALQGTDAHSLCEYKLKKALGKRVRDPTEDLTYFDKEMDECSDEYVSFVLEKFEEAKELCEDPIVLVEQRLDFSRWVPDGFGTGDCVIIADKTLTVIDFKYGMGVLVEAKENPQMMCYALGALDLFDDLYDIEEVTMAIFQPRKSNVSISTMTKDDLLRWGDAVLAPTAQLAYKGEGEFKAGEHCRFCKIKTNCRKRAEYNMALAQYDCQMPEGLTETEIEAILEKADSFVSWISDIKDYALEKALAGTSWKGWKIVEGRSTRRYLNDAVVADKVQRAGFDPYEHKVLGVTAMTRMLGKKNFEELLEGLIEKPEGKPTLVPESDKRPAMNIAANDFSDD